MKKNYKIIAIVLLSIVLGAGGGIYFYLHSNITIIKGDFQNPFLFNNNTLVQTEEDWNSRREEIKDMLMDIEYGHMPDRPDALNATLISTEIRPDINTMKTIILTVIPSNATPTISFNFTLTLYIPDGTGPFPAIVLVSKNGQGSQASNNKTITDRGYIYACFNHDDLDPDEKDVIGPAQTVYSDYDWGTLMVWAWGAMRVADYLLGEVWVNAPDGFPSINKDALIVTGHSRRGKTALLAAAFDERFAMTDPNGSGAGGVGSFLVHGPGCETLWSITRVYGYWFHEDFGDWSGKEGGLPFDQHFIRALIAPRLILSTDGLGDLWANPIGTQAVYNASQPVFDFLGVSENNAIHFREGGHDFLAEDYSVLLNFADKMLLGKSIVDDFYMTPFDIEFPIYYSTPST